jgi:superfamily II DNA or RNA helicase
MSIKDFIPKYPRIQDKSFYQDIFRKDEFYRNRIGTDDESTEENVGSESFKPMKHQIIGSRYISPYTPYDTLLINHEMGTGKCVLPGTNVTLYNSLQLHSRASSETSISSNTSLQSSISSISGDGSVDLGAPKTIVTSTIKIETLWNPASIQCLVSDEEWSIPLNETYVFSYDGVNVCKNKVSRVFRQKLIDQYIVEIQTQSTVLTMTMAHKILTASGWKNAPHLRPFMPIAIYNDIDNTVKYECITSIRIYKYTGYVYDLEVENHHTYIANDVITHNTCYAIGIAEHVRNIDPSVSKVLILSNSDRLLQTFKDQLERCGANSNSKKAYSFKTYTTFGVSLDGLSDENIKTNYSNSIIILDEVHHIHKHSSDKSEKKTRGDIVYRAMHNMLHLVTNSRKLLLTGTPMHNDPTEIVDIMNLILPLDNQMNLSYFKKNDGEGWTLNQQTIDKFRNFFKGRVTYLRADQSQIDLQYISQNPNITKDTGIIWSTCNNIMSEFQSDIYDKAYDIDDKVKARDETKESKEDDPVKLLQLIQKKTASKTIYANTIQASLCVFPTDVDWNTKHLERRKETISSQRKKIRVSELGTYSATYDKVIRELASNETELAFVYCNLVEYSGVDTLVYFLKASKYKDANKDGVINEGISNGESAEEIFSKLDTGVKRYIHIRTRQIDAKDGGLIQEAMKETRKQMEAQRRQKALEKGIQYISGETTALRTSKLLDLFNHPLNRTGKYIHVIVGSKLVEEGYSFKNIRQIHITTPFWNWSETSQAIARGLRAHSHDALIEDGGKVTVKVFLHASIPKNPIKSIDVKRYLSSSEKFKSIQAVQDIIKTMSFDCALLYDRNKLPTDKPYQCDGIDEKVDIDTSTSQLFYARKKAIRDLIITIFKENDYISLDELLSIGRENKLHEFEIMSTINTIITSNEIIFNRYNIGCFLKEYHDVLFLSLISKPGVTNLDNHYTYNPTVLKPISQQEIINQVYSRNVTDAIDKFGLSDQTTKILTPNLTEYLIEEAISNKNNEVILMYTDHIRKQDELVVSYYLKNTINGQLRCKHADEDWRDCKTGEEVAIMEKKIDLKEGYIYGTYDKQGKFSVLYYRKPKITKTGKEDKRTASRGRVCTTCTVGDLAIILVNSGIGKDNGYDAKSGDIKDIKKKYNSIPYSLYKEHKKKFSELTKDEINLYGYWFKDRLDKMSAWQVCDLIEKHMQENNMVVV